MEGWALLDQDSGALGRAERARNAGDLDSLLASIARAGVGVLVCKDEAPKTSPTMTNDDAKKKKN